MPIEDRNLQAGTVLVGRHKSTEHRCEVVETPEGVRYQVDGGEIFKSPSSAAKHVMGGIAANGWRFWSIAGSEKPQRARKATKAKAATKKPAAKKAKSAKPPKSARLAAKDVASYACGACSATFGSQKAAVSHALTHTT